MENSYDYNTVRGHLNMPEYGRNVQKMVEYCMSIADRDERNKVAQAIIVVMGQLNPQLRDVEDFKHKLWTHLFVISDFKLDVDSPYPKPSKEEFTEKPKRVSYPRKNIKFGHYGKTVELLIAKAVEYPDGEEKTALILAIANLMKRSYLTWNRDTVTDDVILQQLFEMSGGKIKTDNITLSSNIKADTQQQQQAGFKKQHRWKNNNFKNKHNKKRY
ncbi:MAG: DUF4290 domain-containing protein [Bacteroidota bacterium]